MKNYNVAAVVAAIAFPLLGISEAMPGIGADGSTINPKAVMHVPQSQVPAEIPSAREGMSRVGAVALNFSQAKPRSQRKSRRTKRAAVWSAATAQYKALVLQFAREYGVPAALAHAIVTVESNYYPMALGKAGEIGLMQIKPSTARRMGYRGSSHESYHPETNIKYGMKYLAAAYKLGGKTTCGTILKYNAGYGAKRMNPISSAYCAKVKRMMAK